MLLLPWFPLLLARMALAIAVIAITAIALIPAQEVPVTTSWDKLDHGFAFFTLALLAEHAFPSQSFWRRIALGLIVYGVGIEITQWLFTLDRDASTMDVLANSLGIAGYGSVRQWISAIFRLAPRSR